MSVGIVGAGVLGLTAAYRLACEGVPVTVYEESGRVGGLAGTTPLAGTHVDRYYHALTLTDDRVIELAAELGLKQSIRWRPLGVGFFHDGRLASMSTPLELLRFPGLSASERARLVAFVARCRLISDQDALDKEPIESWTRRVAGDALWERLWRPLLDSKFDGAYHDLPATYLWSRMRRTAGTRDRSGREVMGWIRGGHQALADALRDAIVARGGEVLTRTPVSSIVSSGGCVQGVAVGDSFHAHDWVVSTLLRPHLDRLLGSDVRAALPADPCRYLGVVCVVARVRKSVSPYYALNITDRSVPLTSVVETTHVVDPEHVGGHLLYVPRYVLPGSPELERDSAELTREYLAQVCRMFPGFDPKRDVIASQVARARFAEPVHRAGVAERMPELLAAPGLAVASSARVYPDIVHAQSIVGVADQVVTELRPRLGAARLEEVAA
ncbi:MAG TPA: FAD-dependent oxidoreductase [Thermoleophilaceae bacterium]